MLPLQVQRNGVRVRIVGDLSRVSPSLYAEMQRVMSMTQHNTRHLLTVCFCYTSRNEIAAAVRTLAGACADGALEPSELDEAHIEGCLYTSPPDCPQVRARARVQATPPTAGVGRRRRGPRLLPAPPSRATS